MTDELREILALLQKIDTRFGQFENRLDRVEGKLAAIEASGDASPAMHLKSKALELDKPGDEDAILCLDFGTARSKAFATQGSDEHLLDLALGQRAGQATAPHSLLSCVYIADDGKIYFGELAAAKSEHAISSGARERFESFKAMVTNASPGSDLRAGPCSAALNPTSARLSEGDILTLYLAYLTDMAATELVERHHLSRYVRRRFTTPVFKPEHQQWASDILRRHYCEAILVADQYSGMWREGIDALEAERVLRAAAAHRSRVELLMADPLVEPRAAFASRFRNYEPKQSRRHLISIVDAGAGTVDFATFAVVEEPGKGLQMFLVDGSVHALRKAGNEVDRMLREYILAQAKNQHEGLDASVLARIKAALSLRQRDMKEALFKTGRAEFALTDDTKGAVELKDFLAEESVQRFSEELRNAFREALAGIDESWLRECAHGRVVVVATGGSSTLPMVQDLARLEFLVRSTKVTCSVGMSIPAWITRDYPELADEYPQLAVALGGSSRNLPEMSERTFDSFRGLSDQGKWFIPPAYKGS
jgi:hypothetical protein